MSEASEKVLKDCGSFLESQGFEYGDFGNYYPVGNEYADQVCLNLDRSNSSVSACIRSCWGGKHHLQVWFSPELSQAERESVLQKLADATKNIAAATLLIEDFES